MSIKNTPDNVIAILTERNNRKPDAYNPKSGNVCSSNMHCTGVSCSLCPFSSKNDPHKIVTMGDLHKELRTRLNIKRGQSKVAESHKGGGAGVYTTGKVEPIELIPTPSTDVDTVVYHPKHYEVIVEVEAIQVIARSMTIEQFKGYCLGNILKYRLRLGAKDAVEQDLKKAQNYKDIFEKHKGLCYDYSK